MTCIKTGAVAYLDEYGEWLYGDAHSYDGVLLFRSVYRTRSVGDLAQFGNARHMTVLRVADWWDEQKTSMGQNSTVISQQGHWGMNGDKEGFREPRLPAAEPPVQPGAPLEAAQPAE
jgi:hypothetical protein